MITLQEVNRIVNDIFNDVGLQYTSIPDHILSLYAYYNEGSLISGTCRTYDYEDRVIYMVKEDHHIDYDSIQSISNSKIIDVHLLSGKIDEYDCGVELIIKNLYDLVYNLTECIRRTATAEPLITVVDYIPLCYAYSHTVALYGDNHAIVTSKMKELYGDDVERITEVVDKFGLMQSVTSGSLYMLGDLELNI